MKIFNLILQCLVQALTSTLVSMNNSLITKNYMFIIPMPKSLSWMSNIPKQMFGGEITHYGGPLLALLDLDL